MEYHYYQLHSGNPNGFVPLENSQRGVLGKGAPVRNRVPSSVLNSAINAAPGISVDLLALGKVGGDIFNSDHRLYDRERDSCFDLLDWIDSPVFN